MRDPLRRHLGRQVLCFLDDGEVLKGRLDRSASGVVELGRVGEEMAVEVLAGRFAQAAGEVDGVVGFPRSRLVRWQVAA